MVAGDDGALPVRLGVITEVICGGIGLARGRVVREAATHEERTEVGEPQPERPEAAAVLLNFGVG